jgi:hypothetical protein
MNALVRALAVLASGAALLVAFAGSANAAVIDVKIASPAAPGKLLTAGPGDLISMQPAGLPNQKWTKAGTTPGFAVYSVAGRCLTGRAGMVTLEPCVSGHPAQAWRSGEASSALILRATGEAATLRNGRVVLAPFTGQPTQRWLQSLA